MASMYWDKRRLSMLRQEARDSEAICEAYRWYTAAADLGYVENHGRLLELEALML